MFLSGLARYWKEKNMVKIDVNNDYNMYYTTGGKSRKHLMTLNSNQIKTKECTTLQEENGWMRGSVKQLMPTITMDNF